PQPAPGCARVMSSLPSIRRVLPEPRTLSAGWIVQDFGAKCIISFPAMARNSKLPSSRRLRRSPLPRKTICESWACFICSSACSFLSAGGTLLAPCTFMSFVWFPSFCGHSTSVGSWTLLTGKFTGQRLWPAFLLLLCCSILRWYFPGGPKRPSAHLRKFLPSTHFLLLCSSFM